MDQCQVTRARVEYRVECRVLFTLSLYEQRPNLTVHQKIFFILVQLVHRRYDDIQILIIEFPF